MQVKDSVVAVTGAARGIGAAIALTFARAGAHLALLDLPTQSCEDSLARCSQLGVTARSYECDISDETQVVRAYQRIAEDLGRLDVQVNNAGILRDGLLVKVEQGRVVRTLSLEQWRAVIDVNLTG